MVATYDGGLRGWVDTIFPGLDECWLCNERTKRVVLNGGGGLNSTDVRSFKFSELTFTGEWCREVEVEETIPISAGTLAVLSKRKSWETDWTKETGVTVLLEPPLEPGAGGKVVIGPGFPPEVKAATLAIGKHLEEVSADEPPPADVKAEAALEPPQPQPASTEVDQSATTAAPEPAPPAPDAADEAKVQEPAYEPGGNWEPEPQAASAAPEATPQLPRRYLLDNSVRQAATSGVRFRTSKDLDAVLASGPLWGTEVEGVEEGDWLRVAGPMRDLYLPMHDAGVLVLRPLGAALPPSEAGTTGLAPREAPAASADEGWRQDSTAPVGSQPSWQPPRQVPPPRRPLLRPAWLTVPPPPPVRQPQPLLVEGEGGAALPTQPTPTLPSGPRVVPPKFKPPQMSLQTPGPLPAVPAVVQPAKRQSLAAALLAEADAVVQSPPALAPSDGAAAQQQGKGAPKGAGKGGKGRGGSSPGFLAHLLSQAAATRLGQAAVAGESDPGGSGPVQPQPLGGGGKGKGAAGASQGAELPNHGAPDLGKGRAGAAGVAGGAELQRQDGQGAGETGPGRAASPPPPGDGAAAPKKWSGAFAEAFAAAFAADGPPAPAGAAASPGAAAAPRPAGAPAERAPSPPPGQAEQGGGAPAAAADARAWARLPLWARLEKVQDTFSSPADEPPPPKPELTAEEKAELERQAFQRGWEAAMKKQQAESAEAAAKAKEAAPATAAADAGPTNGTASPATQQPPAAAGDRDGEEEEPGSGGGSPQAAGPQAPPTPDCQAPAAPAPPAADGAGSGPVAGPADGPAAAAAPAPGAPAPVAAAAPPAAAAAPAAQAAPERPPNPAAPRPAAGGQDGGGLTVQDWVHMQEQFAHMPKLPPGWIRIRSKKNNRIYFVNTLTGETTFVEPDDLPPGWIKQVSRSTGKPYYFHAATGRSVFDKPTS